MTSQGQGQGGKAQEEGSSENERATQESIFEGLGERIVEDALNVSRGLQFR